jgi:hypothetical protein
MGDVSKGVTLAIGIVLLWITGVCFWLAFSDVTGQPNAGGGIAELEAITHDVTGGVK